MVPEGPARARRGHPAVVPPRGDPCSGSDPHRRARPGLGRAGRAGDPGNAGDLRQPPQGDLRARVTDRAAPCR